MAPNVFHIGVKEQVSISVFDAGNPVTVKLYLQDYPHRQKTFSQVQGQVNQGEFNFFFNNKRSRDYENIPCIMRYPNKAFQVLSVMGCNFSDRRQKSFVMNSS